MGGLIELAEMVLRHTRSAARRLDRQLFAVAGTLAPPELRSLDALHIAAALTVSQDMADFVTYDARIISAAQAQGLPVVSPS